MIKNLLFITSSLLFSAGFCVNSHASQTNTNNRLQLIKNPNNVKITPCTSSSEDAYKQIFCNAGIATYANKQYIKKQVLDGDIETIYKATNALKMEYDISQEIKTNVQNNKNQQNNICAYQYGLSNISWINKFVGLISDYAIDNNIESIQNEFGCSYRIKYKCCIPTTIM